VGSSIFHHCYSFLPVFAMQADDNTDAQGRSSASASSTTIQELIASYRHLNEALAQKTDSCQAVTRHSMQLLEKAHGAKAKLLAQNHLLKTISAELKNRSAQGQGAHSPDQLCQQHDVMQRSSTQVPQAPGVHGPGLPCQQPDVRQQPGIESAKGQSPPQLHQQPQQMAPTPHAHIEQAVDLRHVVFEVASLGGPEALARVLREALESNASASNDTVWEECD